MTHRIMFYWNHLLNQIHTECLVCYVRCFILTQQNIEKMAGQKVISGLVKICDGNMHTYVYTCSNTKCSLRTHFMIGYFLFLSVKPSNDFHYQNEEAKYSLNPNTFQKCVFACMPPNSPGFLMTVQGG